MDDRKADAAFHPHFKIRDEIAQKDVDTREQYLGVDLSELPVKELHELGQGDMVLHEGIWVRLDEYEVNDEHNCIRLKMVLPDAELGTTWARHIIASRTERFYVPAEVPSARAAGARRRAARNPDLVRRVPPKEDLV